MQHQCRFNYQHRRARKSYHCAARHVKSLSLELKRWCFILQNWNVTGSACDWWMILSSKLSSDLAMKKYFQCCTSDGSRAVGRFLYCYKIFTKPCLRALLPKTNVASRAWPISEIWRWYQGRSWTYHNFFSLELLGNPPVIESVASWYRSDNEESLEQMGKFSVFCSYPNQNNWNFDRRNFRYRYALVA